MVVNCNVEDSKEIAQPMDCKVEKLEYNRVEGNKLEAAAVDIVAVRMHSSSLETTNTDRLLELVAKCKFLWRAHVFH